MRSVDLLTFMGLFAASAAGCGGTSVASQASQASDLEKIRTELEVTRAQLKSAVSESSKPHLAVALATARKFLEAPENGGFTFRISKDAPNGSQALSNTGDDLHGMVEFQLTKDAAGNLVFAGYTITASENSNQPELTKRAVKLTTDFVSLLDPEIDTSVYSGMYVDAMKVLNSEPETHKYSILQEYSNIEIQFSLIRVAGKHIMSAEIRPRRGEYE